MTRSDFQKALARYFSLEELRTLAVELGIEHDQIPANAREEYARELISYCGRRLGYIEQLIELCKRERSGVNWSYEQPQHRKFFLATNKFSWFIVGVLIFVIVFLYIENLGAFGYTVSVSSTETGASISGAKVILELQELPPLNEFTDTNGYAVFTIPNTQANSRTLLIVQAEGYIPHSQQILIKKNKLPHDVRLERAP